MRPFAFFRVVVLAFCLCACADDAPPAPPALADEIWSVIKGGVSPDVSQLRKVLERRAFDLPWMKFSVVILCHLSVIREPFTLVFMGRDVKLKDGFVFVPEDGFDRISRDDAMQVFRDLRTPSTRAGLSQMIVIVDAGTHFLVGSAKYNTVMRIRSPKANK